MTVNCARIIHGNQMATNGVVHVIDRVISAAGNTIKEILDVSDELSSFSVCNINTTLSTLKLTTGDSQQNLFFSPVIAQLKTKIRHAFISFRLQ